MEVRPRWPEVPVLPSSLSDEEKLVPSKRDENRRPIRRERAQKGKMLMWREKARGQRTSARTPMCYYSLPREGKGPRKKKVGRIRFATAEKNKENKKKNRG